MMEKKKGRQNMRRRYTTRQAAVDTQIQKLVSVFEDPFDRTLLAELVTSVYRLGEDRASTLDLKVLNSALKELRYAFRIFRPFRDVRKVAIFGSARTSKKDPSYAMAKAFGRRMVQNHWMVITGAASGIMKAGHEGAGRAASFGLNIRLPFEQEANPVIAEDEKLVNCKYFFTRKLLFIKESHAIVLFPGGFGTLDEGFECLTLVQTGKADPRPIVFVENPEGQFWKPLIDFFNDRLVREGMIYPTEGAIYQVARSAEEAAQSVLNFYRVYHSMRYVGDRLVLRLNHPLSKESVSGLSEEFRDIVVSGGIVQGKALPEELKEQADEPELKKLSRLILRFNRRDYGKLITLIHRVNELGQSRSD